MRALAVMDVVPTGEAFARADAAFALGYWQWTFLAVEAGHVLPEEAPAEIVDALRGFLGG